MDKNIYSPEGSDDLFADDSTRIVPVAPEEYLPQDSTAESPANEEPEASVPMEHDPLDNADVLPTLFPETSYDEDEEDYQEPTVVQRPPQRKKSTARKVLRVCAVLGKYLLALVLAAAILAAGLVGYLTLTEYNPAHAEVAQRGAVSAPDKLSEKSLRILSFNTGFGALDEDADFFMDGGSMVNPDSQTRVEENMRGIEEILRDSDADFLFLQEVDMDSDRTFHLNQWLQYEYDLEDYESRYAPNYVCKYVPYPLNDMIGEINSGIATYSRYDISSATRYSLPNPFSWPTRVANLKRCMLVTRIATGDENAPELVLVNVHLEAYDDGEGKAAQTEQLMEFVEAEYEKGNYVIVGGDFNQLFPGTEREYPLKETSDWTPTGLESLPTGWRYAFDDSTPTCRLLNQPYDPSSKLTQYYVIDGFLVSPNVKIVSVETLDEGFAYSDHNPVLLEVSLDAEE